MEQLILFQKYLQWCIKLLVSSDELQDTATKLFTGIELTTYPAGRYVKMYCALFLLVNKSESILLTMYTHTIGRDILFGYKQHCGDLIEEKSLPDRGVLL